MNLKDDDCAIAVKAKSVGTAYYRSKNYSKAFANYLLALNIRKDWFQELEDAFIHSLCEWGSFLEKEARYTDLFTCYEEALKICPRSEVVLNNLGAHLLRLNHVKEASRYFRECLIIDPLYLPARKNLENVSNLLVERWHFRMLNDEHRNSCYRRVLHSAVKQGHTVLDIGTGTGLLSLYAAEKNPKVVYACDYSEVMSSFASDIVKKNNLCHKIKVINKSSDDLLIPTDLTERVFLLVTEIMDAGLIGEGLLESLDDAWKRLMIPTEALSDPACQRVIPKCADLFFAPVESQYLARKYKFKRDDSQNLPFDLISESKADFDEPYDSEDLKSIEFQFLSRPCKIFHFDFNSATDVREHLDGEKDTESTVICDRSGRLDAFVVWFDLYLDETEMISTSPSSSVESCWEQAIFLVKQNIQVLENTTINVNMSTSGGKLSLRSYNVDVSHTKQQTYLNVSKDIVRFLNSKSTLKQYRTFLNKLLEKDTRLLEVLELSVYPYVGLNLLVNKRAGFVSFHTNPLDVEFLKSQARKYNDKLYSFHSIDNLAESLNRGSKYDVIILELFNSHGELNDCWMNLYPALRNSVKDGGVIFPSQVTIHCQLAYSEWLDKNSKLNNASLLTEYKAFDLLNDFQVNHFVDLNISKLKYTEMSEVLTVARMSTDEVFHDRLREFAVTCQVPRDGRINSILYWFSYGDEAAMLSSNSHDFYRNQGADSLTRAFPVDKGDVLTVTLNYMSCILKFDVINYSCT